MKHYRISCLRSINNLLICLIYATNRDVAISWMIHLWRYRGSKRVAFEQTTLISGRIETRRLYIFPQMKDY